MAKRFFTPIDLTGTINENNSAPERSMKWSDGEGTIEVGLKGGDVKLAVGQEEVALCYNGTGSVLSKGQVVYVSGAQGQRPTLALASASSESSSSKTFGVVAETILDGSEGFVCTFGLVKEINTSSFTEGSALWLSITPGQISQTMPVSPNHAVFIGYCVKSHASAGQIFVKIQNGYELEELHNVLITSPSTGQVLEYDSATGLWKNSDPAEGAVFEVFYQNDAPISPQLGDIWVDANEDLPDYDNPSINTLVPNQTGNSGKFLTTDGSSVGWGVVNLSLYAPLDSPSLTGVPTAPTAIAGTNTTQIATTEFVQTAAVNAASALIDSAPETLNTLNELAAALGDDPNYATTISTALGNKQPLDADLTAISALTGSTGFLKKTAEETWSIDTNTYLTGNQTITLSGDVSGSGTTSIEVTIADDSHNHIIDNVDGLQTALDGKEPSISSGTTSQYWRGDKSWQTLDKSSVGLGNVENTALSTWEGTSNITTLGTIGTGTWQGTSISTSYTDAKVTSVNGSTGAITGLATLASPTFTGTITLDTAAPINFKDNNNILEGKIFSNNGAFYIQGGTSNSDGTASIIVSRTGTTTTSISSLNIYADTTIFSGRVVAPISTNTQTASYTLVLSDDSKLIEMNVSSANNITIPLNSSVAFPIGTKIDIIQIGSGQTTIVPTSGVTMNSYEGANKLSGQWAAATLIKRNTDTWALIGNITA